MADAGQTVRAKGRYPDRPRAAGARPSVAAADRPRARKGRAAVRRFRQVVSRKHKRPAPSRAQAPQAAKKTHIIAAGRMLPPEAARARRADSAGHPSTEPPLEAAHPAPAQRAGRVIMIQGPTIADLRAAFEVSGDSRANSDSALKWFMEVNGLSDRSSLAPALTLMFEANLETYLNSARCQGVTKATRISNISRLRAWRTKAEEVVERHRRRHDSLPADFRGALLKLIELCGMSAKRVARAADLPWSTFQHWRTGRSTPPKSSVDNAARIARLAEVLHVDADVFLRRMHGPVALPRRGENEEPATEYRRRIKKRSRQPYSMSDADFERRLGHAWRRIFAFHTGRPSKTLIRNPKNVWRVRLPDHYCATGLQYEQQVKDFAGFCALPAKPPQDLPKAEHAANTGLGMPLRKIAMGLVSDIDRLDSFLAFKLERAGKYTSGHLRILSLARILTDPNTGLLARDASLRGDYMVRASAKRWLEHCRQTNEWAKATSAFIRMNAQKGRDLDDELRGIIDHPHPLSRLSLLVENFERDRPLSIESDLRKSVWMRDRVLIRFAFSNPLRPYNIIHLTYRKDGTGQLRKAHGRWRVVIDKSEFKNFRHAIQATYDVEVSETLWPLLDSFLLKGWRDKFPDADKNDFVFLPSTERADGSLAWHGACVRATVVKLTRRYLPDTLGFSLQAFRHIVATGWLRAHPNDFLRVSEILHDKLETVMKAYAHLRVGHEFAVYTRYYDTIVPPLVADPL